ncbi:hypothetical protein E4U40_002882 [Claviceps sp. LM458 group G5]|nr:hypothetical protein E4U40_002882 [Claviceps sp. LM458 group G5]
MSTCARGWALRGWEHSGGDCDAAAAVGGVVGVKGTGSARREARGERHQTKGTREGTQEERRQPRGHDVVRPCSEKKTLGRMAEEKEEEGIQAVRVNRIARVKTAGPKGSGQSLSLALFDKKGTTRAGTWGNWFAPSCWGLWGPTSKLRLLWDWSVGAQA